MKKVVSFWLLSGLFLTGVPAFALPEPAARYRISISDSKSEKPSVSKAFFGETDGQQVYQYTLRNGKGMLVKVINYGAAITDIITPDKHHEMGSVVLGFDSLASYTGRDNALLGAVAGRVANRIANKRFTLDGKEYILSSNIHGGVLGFHKRIWNIEEVRGKEAALKMTYFSKDGEEGYPGNVSVAITYTLTSKNELIINYQATTDQATPVVLTNHSYFNLSGGRDDKVLHTELTIYADRFLEAARGPFPTGNFLDVKGSPFDFTVPQQIGSRIEENNAQLTPGGGYDLTFVLRNTTGRLALAASAYEPISGRVMQVYTTEPGVVFYTGNHLNERIRGRGAKPFTKYGAFCLETQHFPDSPNQPAFPNTILRPGETYRSQTIYRFSVRN